jgi:hypothetical protein
MKITKFLEYQVNGVSTTVRTLPSTSTNGRATAGVAYSNLTSLYSISVVPHKPSAWVFIKV